MKEMAYPNQMVQQKPMEYVHQKALEQVDHVATFGQYVVDHVGWGWLLTSAAVGASFVVLVIFKAQAKKFLGEWVRILNKILNG